jgi:hypothetical protein
VPPGLRFLPVAGNDCAVKSRSAPLVAVLALLAAGVAAEPAAPGRPADYLSRYDIAWSVPSRDSSGSMPLGGGDLGVNVWVENGDLLFYAAQSGAFDKNGEALKLGRFRFTLDPNPLLGGTFRQELDVREGCIRVTGESPSAGKVTVKVWVEAGRSAVHLDVAAERPLALTATYESWRYRDVDLPPEHRPAAGRRSSIFDFDGYQVNVVKRGDTIEPGADGIVWWHDVGREFNAFDFSLQTEGLTALKPRLWDPLVQRVSGGLMRGANLAFAGTADGVYADTPYRAWRYRSRAPARTQRIEVFARVAQPVTPSAWKDDLARIAGAPADPDRRWREHVAWWDAFWAQAYVIINPQRGEADNGWRVGRNYNLFRAQLGGSERGDAPVKFNGGNLTFDAKLVNPGYNFGPDYRRWGGWSYTAANQQLVYWGYLKNGDFAAMLPQFDVYRRALGNAEARTRAHWGHGGAAFAEQFQHSGMPVASHYGFLEHGFSFFQRPEGTPPGEMANPWISTLYAGELDFALMILEYQRFSGRDISPYLPFIFACLEFYDQHYQQVHRAATGRPLDENGRLVIFPSTPGEHHLNSTNPSDAIAGLIAVTDGLRGLPPGVLDPGQLAYAAGLRRRIPPLPTYKAMVDGRARTFFGLSEKDGGDGSSRQPGLFGLFPYAVVHRGGDHFDWMADTWDCREPAAQKIAYIGWQRTPIYLALLGRAEEARETISRKLEDAARLPESGQSKPNRFPTFWGPGYDWAPDHNWGGSGLIGLEDMLLQTPGDAIYLLPAWPKEWDVEFKLHAPKNTIVQARYAGGKLLELTVTPPERARDIIYAGERGDAKK